MNQLSKQGGASLIEVLIALFVLAVGMLGVLAMQTTAVKTSRNASFISQAQLLSVEIYEAMRAANESDVDQFLINYDETPQNPTCTTAGTPCSGTQMANWHLTQWRANVASTLPGGKSQITRNAVTGEYSIEVEFSTGYEEDANGAVSQTTDSVVLSAIF